MLRAGAPLSGARGAMSPAIRANQRRLAAYAAAAPSRGPARRSPLAAPRASATPPQAPPPPSLVDKLLAAARPASQKVAAAEAAANNDGGPADERVLRVGFRYDAANLRWVRDKRQDGRAFDMSKALIRPFTGGQYMSWPVCHGLLADAGLRSVPAQEARAMQKKGGWTLVDVRLPDAHAAERAEGSAGAPLFRYLDERPAGEPGNGAWDVAKKVAMAAFAMRATERVPRWAEEFPFLPPSSSRQGGGGGGAAAAAAAGWFGGLFGGGGGGSKTNNMDDKNSKDGGKTRVGKGVLLICSVGGSMQTEITFRRGKYSDPERAFGRESRSLKAAYELLSRADLGWTSANVVHVEGGLAQWRFEGLPVEGGEGGEVVGSEADELAAEEAEMDADEVRRRRRRRQRQRAGGMLGLPF